MKAGLIGLAVAAFACAAGAEDQVWNDGGADNVWSTNAANWDAGAMWTNGNSAVFAGAGGTLLGETIDIAATVTVANVTFLTNNYVIADTNADGSLSFVGGPSVIAVSHASDTAVIGAAIRGGGFTKTGPGTLQLKGTNTYTGVTTVSAGTLKLNFNTPDALGAVGTGNHTVVADGATLDFNGCYVQVVNSTFFGRDEDLIVSGSGVGGLGALVNSGASIVNNGFRGLTLVGNTVIGGSGRIDLRSTGVYCGNGYTLTKIGSCEFAVGCPVTNSPIIINDGIYTIQTDAALGGSDYPTTLNGGKLMSWASHTISERLIVNGGTISVNADKAYTFLLTGNITFNSNAVMQTEWSPTNTLELSGVIDGAAGFTCNGSGFIQISGGANTYSGPTTVNSGTRLRVGKTVGGTGKLGSGAVTNNGTLYANSAVLSAGGVVNKGSLYLNPPTLSVGQIVNVSGTVYGTSVVQAARGVVNSGTWQCYSGSFGDSVFTNASGGTLNLYTNVFTCGSFVNGGTVNILNPMILTNAVTFSGGTVYFGVMSNTLALTGPLTLNSTFALNSALASVIELSGKISGPGGLTRSGDGQCFVTCDSNDYTGPTIINGGKTLWVGIAGLADGRLGSGAITNNGTLYFDSVGAYTNSNGINGSGITAIRYGGLITVNGGVSSISIFNVASGTLTLTNGAFFDVYGAMTVANRSEVNYAPIPTNVTAVVNVNEGCTLRVANVTFGNGNEPSGGTMTGILNQAGGIVRTTGTTAEGNGIRLGHYPAARSFYNMMGGTLIVGGDYDLGCATDGQGWFNMTGGEVFTTRVMLNERDNRTMPGGYGRLTVAGGVLNVGSLNASVGAITNAITVDPYAPYLVEYGGAGGIVRAVTNLYLPLDATLYGTGTNAVTFDTSSFATYQSGNLSGAGGLNKSGSGTLVLSGTNTYAGGTRILAGTVQLSATCVGPTGTVAFAVSTNGVGGVLASAGDLSLAGMTVAVANPESLDKSSNYTIASWSGSLTSPFGMSALPWPWYVNYDWAGKTAQLRAANGTVIRLR